MNLYTDDNPHTTLGGLGFNSKEKALESILIVEAHFDNMSKQQITPGWTPNNVLPREYLNNISDLNKYYAKQKMYRILGLRNRAVGLVKHVKNKDGINEAIIIFDEWLALYKKQFGGGGYKNCCVADEGTDQECIRQSDGKHFKLPRKFSRHKCSQGIHGFTMRSSCAPFKDCF